LKDAIREQRGAHPLDATNPIHEGYSFTVFECRKTHGGISHWNLAYVLRRRISTWPEVQSRLKEKGEGKGDQNFTLAHHRYRGARVDNALARFDSSNGNTRVPPIVRSESARLEPLGRVVMTYQFIKVAEFLLGTRRSISFVIISYY
jgi:hypothetical protein